MSRKFFTTAERVLLVRMFQDIEHPFCVQHREGEYCIDFAFLNEKVAIEVDGPVVSHPKQFQKVCERDANLHNDSWKVFRFTDSEVIHNVESVVEKIKNEVDWRHLEKEYGELL